MDVPRMEERDAALLNPLQLAYIGDSVWETMVRSHLIFQRKNVHNMHVECVRFVNAAAQAKAVKKLRPYLSETETAIVQRGRNAHPRHAAPRSQDPADYSESTGFESLIGFLYLTGDYDRLTEIQNRILCEETEDA